MIVSRECCCLRILVLFLALFASPVLSQGAFAVFDLASKPVLNSPHDLAFGPDGQLYVADKVANQIVVLDPETLEVLSTFGDGRLTGVQDISFGPDGSALVAVSAASSLAVFEVDPKPRLVRGVVGIARSEGALAHSNGRIYMMASGPGVLMEVVDSAPVSMATGHSGAHDVTEAPDGSIWVADDEARRLVRYSPELELLQVLEGAAFGFIRPSYLDVDPWGRLVVADPGAHRILLIDPKTETLLGVLGDGLPGLGPDKFDAPAGIAVRGNVYYVSDSDNNRVGPPNGPLRTNEGCPHDRRTTQAHHQTPQSAPHSRSDCRFPRDCDRVCRGCFGGARRARSGHQAFGRTSPSGGPCADRGQWGCRYHGDPRGPRLPATGGYFHGGF